jgi:hypothetical protein
MERGGRKVRDTGNKGKKGEKGERGWEKSRGREKGEEEWKKFLSFWNHKCTSVITPLSFEN